MKRYKAIAEYYDDENARHAMLAQDVPCLLGHLPRRRQSILELAVGTGRAAIPLVQAGHRVVGVDYARDMLEIARQKRDAVGIAPSDLSLVHADVLKINLNRRFDWIILLFNTFLVFTTLARQDALLQVVAKHLKRSGKFWLDIFNPDLALLSARSIINLEPYVFHAARLNRTVFRTTSIRRDSAAQRQSVTFHYTWFNSFGVAIRRNVRFDMTFVLPRELRILMERNGFRIEKLYGNYDRSPLDSDSPRMIALCGR